MLNIFNEIPKIYLKVISDVVLRKAPNIIDYKNAMHESSNSEEEATGWGE